VLEKLIYYLKQYIFEGGGLEQCQSDGGNRGGGGMVQ